MNMVYFTVSAAFSLIYLATAVAQEVSVPLDVKLSARGHGWILSNSAGMTLYTYVKDPIGGPSLCNGECADVWRPLEVESDYEVGGDWSTNVRDDGMYQWYFRGKPLYTYSRDTDPGDMNGDEYQRQWYAALKPIQLPPGFNTIKTKYGYLLADHLNMTLYTNCTDTPSASTCNADCAKTWRPAEAWWRARTNIPDWSLIDRPDGNRQWAYKSQPLYRYAGDFQSGEIAGEGVDKFLAVVLEPPPALPGWISIQHSDAGPLLAESDGKTLYAYDLPENRAFGTPFDIGTSRDMATPHLWSPIYAESPANSIGHWSVQDIGGGRYQWAYKGLRIFVYKGDKEPGDLNGQRGTDRYWRTIMQNGEDMAGAGR